MNQPKIIHDGFCPCGCGTEVPSGRFYASSACQKRFNRVRQKTGKKTPYMVATKKEKIERKPRCAECKSVLTAGVCVKCGPKNAAEKRLAEARRTIAALGELVRLSA